MPHNNNFQLSINYKPDLKYFSGLSISIHWGGVCFEYGKDGAVGSMDFGKSRE